MPSLPSSPSITGPVLIVDPVDTSPPLNNANHLQDHDDPERSEASRDHDFALGIRRRDTLPVPSQVPTPQGSDDEDGDEDGDIKLKGSASQSSKSTDSLLSNNPDPSGSNSLGEKALEVMEKLDTLVGVDDIKSQFRELGLYIHNSQVLGVESTDERFHALFQGNPGTGKTTVAKLYAQFLKAMGVLKLEDVVETSGVKLASSGPRAMLDMFEDRDGGLLFVDEAYQLVSSHSSVAGKQVLDVILSEMDCNPPRWVIIFAGYKEEFEPFFAHNDGLSSRIPQVLTFEDFSNAQLRSIFLSFFRRRFSRHKFEIEGGIEGLFVKAVVRRIAQGRARRGFGNARTVRNYFQRICQRQARRVGQLDKPTRKDRLFFTKEDLLGPKPLDVKATSKTWAKLNSLIGLHEVKKSVDIMFRIVDYNYQRELKGERPLTHSLNRIFVGPPGTGKTTVAKLYGKILAEIGLLSKGDGTSIGTLVVSRQAANFGICLQWSSKPQQISSVMLLAGRNPTRGPSSHRLWARS